MDKQTEIQEELMTALLEGEQADCYVVITPSALVSQIQIAIHETPRNSKGEIQVGRAAARLIRNLGQIGFTKNTKPNQVYAQTEDQS